MNRVARQLSWARFSHINGQIIAKRYEKSSDHVVVSTGGESIQLVERLIEQAIYGPQQCESYHSGVFANQSLSPF